MKQGTVSIICGCHSLIHSIYVIIAWTKLYKKLPSAKEIFCILLHDIGHIGKDYLDDFEEKKSHWILGATIARKLFGEEEYVLTAGHSRYSGLPKSKLYYADKLSWYIASKYWLWMNTIFEPKLKMGSDSSMDAVNWFKLQVKYSIENNLYQSTHGFYLERSKR